MAVEHTFTLSGPGKVPSVVACWIVVAFGAAVFEALKCPIKSRKQTLRFSVELWLSIGGFCM